MSTVHVIVPHTKPVNQLHERVRAFDDRLKKIGISTQWSGDQGVIKHPGLKRDGSIALSPERVEIKLELGFLLDKTIGRERLTQLITRELTEALA